MFYYEIPWFYQDFKSKNLCFLNLCSVHATRILSLSLEVTLSPPSQRSTFTTPKGGARTRFK